MIVTDITKYRHCDKKLVRNSAFAYGTDNGGTSDGPTSATTHSWPLRRDTDKHHYKVGDQNKIWATVRFVYNIATTHAD